MNNYKITIVHLYPDLLNLYGDKGNIECLRKRLNWRNIDTEVILYTAENENFDFSAADIIFLGGGSDREMEIVCESLKSKKEELSDFIEAGGTFIALCGGYPMLGEYYQTSEKTIEGLGILNIKTDFLDGNRVTGNVILECNNISHPIVGFENHVGKTNIESYTPFGKVIKGGGNDGKGGYEGIIYKNLTATYLHGPLFPKNPQLCDRILLQALKTKYSDYVELPLLDDELELKANKYMVNRG